MLNANSAGEYITDQLLGRAANDDMRAELISARAEAMLEKIRDGEDIEGIDLDRTIEQLMETGLMHQAIRETYLLDNKAAMKLIDWDLECSAYALAEKQLKEC